MSIQRLCYLGGGSITEALPGVGVQGGKEHSSQGNRSGNRRTKGPINFEGKGNRENMGNKGTGTIFPPWEGLISSL